MATDKPLFVAQQPTRYLPRRHGLHHNRVWPRGDQVTCAVRVEGHVLRREPPAARMVALVRRLSPPPFSAPFNLLPEGRNAEVAQLTEDNSDQGTRRRL